MSNQYRIKTSDLFPRSDDDVKEEPQSVVFIATEGTVTEYDYFRYVDKYRVFLGINKLVRIEAIKREKKNSQSNPEAILDVLNEIVELHENGIDIDRLFSDLPNGNDINRLRQCINNSESNDDNYPLLEDLQKTLKDKGLNLAYLKFISEYGERNDIFCVLLDKDKASHSKKQLLSVLENCDINGYKFYISSPCFEFWLLLHLCDVKKEYAERLIKIKDNEKISDSHTYVSKEVSKIAHHSKHISEKIFVDHYFNSIDKAIEHAFAFESDEKVLITSDVIGTNIPELFSLLFAK